MVGSGGGGGGGGSSGRRVFARLALFAALVLAVGVLLAAVEVGVSLRWISGRGGDGGRRGGSSVSLSSINAGDEDIKEKGSGVSKDGDLNASSDKAGLDPPGTPWAGGGKRAYAVREGARRLHK